MEIQSLSVVVPGDCPNNCPFCVSKLNKENQKFKNDVLNFSEITKRMDFARDNGCNTLVITSTGEALSNLEYFANVLRINKKLSKPFHWIELQTSGLFYHIDDYNQKEIMRLDDFIDSISSAEYHNPFFDISTISLSVADIFDDENNAKIMGMKKVLNLKKLIKFLKERNFNIRLSINLTNLFNIFPVNIFNKLKEFDVDQVTFRKLYGSGENTKQDEWIRQNRYGKMDDIITYIENNGRQLEILPFGTMKYSICGVSTVIDNDCMNTESKDTMKYLILRPNGKLYSKWDDKGSLIF